MMNTFLLAALRGPFLFPCFLAVYYAVCWVFVGRKPGHRTIIVRYEPPQGITPAGARYVLTQGVDGRSLAAVVADLAARGCVSVVPQSDVYLVTRTMSSADAQKILPPEEQEVLSLLFYSGDSVTLDPAQSGHSTLAEHLVKSLRSQFGNKYFTGNFGYVAAAAFVGFLYTLIEGLLIPSRDRLGIIFSMVWLTFTGYVLGAIFWAGLVSMWKSALRGMASWKRPLQLLLVFAVFGAGSAFLYRQLAVSSTSAYADSVGLIVLISVALAPILKNYTALGSQTLDEIEGFRQYLVEVEQDRLSRLNSPGASPQLVNEFLPFAIALDVREAWGDHLAGAFVATEIQKDE